MTNREMDLKDRTRARLMVWNGVMPPTFRKQNPTPADFDKSLFDMRFIDPLRERLWRSLDRWIFGFHTTRPGPLVVRGLLCYTIITAIYYGFNSHLYIDKYMPKSRFRPTDMTGFTQEERKEMEYEWQYARGSFVLPESK